MEICVNDYIRTKEGYICKIDKIDECKYCGQNVYIYKETIGDLHFEHTYHKGDITKHSKNIIDLIEVGDYVNGVYINLIMKDEGKVYHDAYDMYDCQAFGNEDIKTILTHEQYEQYSYKL